MMLSYPIQVPSAVQVPNAGENKEFKAYLLSVPNAHSFSTMTPGTFFLWIHFLDSTLPISPDFEMVIHPENSPEIRTTLQRGDMVNGLGGAIYFCCKITNLSIPSGKLVLKIRNYPGLVVNDLRVTSFVDAKGHSIPPDALKESVFPHPVDVVNEGNCSFKITLPAGSNLSKDFFENLGLAIHFPVGFIPTEGEVKFVLTSCIDSSYQIIKSNQDLVDSDDGREMLYFEYPKFWMSHHREKVILTMDKSSGLSSARIEGGNTILILDGNVSTIQSPGSNLGCA